MPKPALFALKLIAVFLIIAFSCKKQRNTSSFAASSYYEKGESLYDINNDSAFYYFNKATVTTKDSLEIAMAYSYMGIIQSGAGDYYGSQESLLLSLQHLDEKNAKDQNCLLSDFNELGRISLSLKNYDAAINYYNKALQFINDDDTRAVVLNNKAVAYQKQHLYSQSISLYESILITSKSDKKLYPRVLSNLAYNKWLQKGDDHALRDLYLAVQMQEHEKDKWGLNANYAHLADYYTLLKRDSAFKYANKMYEIAQQLNSPDDELEALQKIISLGPADFIKKYFVRYQYLNDSLQSSRNNAKNQFALIRYEVAKSKADNLSLQKDNTEKKLQILYQWIIIIAVTASGIGIVLWLKKRRQQMLHDQQLKTSQKVHDVVANGLYRLMMKAEYEKKLDKKSLLDDIENLYEKSRNISYEEIGAVPVNRSNSMSDLFTSFGTPVTRISVVGNSEEIWEKLNPKIKEELTYVLEELMVNMKKHSNAHNVVIRFEPGSHALQIHYFDDGKGLPQDFHYNNGLRNTETRIKTLGGSISFDKSVTKGLKIQLSVPIV